MPRMAIKKKKIHHFQGLWIGLAGDWDIPVSEGWEIGLQI